MGVNQLNIGSLAVKESDKLVSWMEKYEADKFILSVDLKDGMVATHGWMNTSNMSASEFISKYLEHGLKYVVSTDVAKDGMMSGPNFELYRSLVSEFPELRIIASGGVSKEEDILDLIPTGVDGVITGKAIYEGTLDLKKILANVN